MNKIYSELGSFNAISKKNTLENIEKWKPSLNILKNAVASIQINNR